MKVNFLNFSINNQLPCTRKANYTAALMPLECDTFVSFGAKEKPKPTLQETIDKLGEKNIPARVLTMANNVINESGDTSEISLYDIHMQAYAPLLNYQTWDDLIKDAKFPEFEQIEQIGSKPLIKGTMPFKIANGEIPGVTVENIAVMLLKKQYCLVESENYNFTTNESNYLKKMMNFPEFKKEYSRTIIVHNPEFQARQRAALKQLHQDPEFKAKCAAAASKTLTRLNQDPEFKAKSAAAASKTFTRLHQDPEFKAKQAAAASKTLTRLNQDPEFRAKSAAATSKTLTRLHQDPEFIAKRDAAASKTFTRLHQDPEFKAKQAAAASKNLTRLHQDPEFKAKSAAAASKTLTRLHQDPEFKAVHAETTSRAVTKSFEEMPEYVHDIYSELAKEFLGLTEILEKERKGKPLTDTDMVHKLKYFKTVHKECPELAEFQSQGMKKWQSLCYQEVKAEYEAAKAANALDTLPWLKKEDLEAIKAKLATENESN